MREFNTPAVTPKPLPSAPTAKPVDVAPTPVRDSAIVYFNKEAQDAAEPGAEDDAEPDAEPAADDVGELEAADEDAEPAADDVGELETAATPDSSMPKKKVKAQGGKYLLSKLQKEKTMANLDADGDSKIDLGEFIAAGGTEAEFAVLDADGSGFVTQEELDADKTGAANGELTEVVAAETEAASPLPPKAWVPLLKGHSPKHGSSKTGATASTGGHLPWDSLCEAAASSDLEEDSPSSSVTGSTGKLPWDDMPLESQ